MSTALLSTPGKVHELCDDLESHFFVILYTSLHFLKHVRPPGIRMKFIFDDAFISPVTGSHRGGEGKMAMYDKIEFNFESEPLTDLICALLELFRSLKDYIARKSLRRKTSPSLVKDIGKLTDCAEIKKLYAEALRSEGWPTICDKVEDQYPPTSRLTPEEKETVAVSFQQCDLTTEPSTGKRKREDGDLPVIPPPPPPPRPQRRHKGKH